MRRDHEAEFEAFVRDSRGDLLATALHLTGDPHLAEDLVQTALVRLYVAWGRARRTNLGGYARRTLVNCFIDHRRRPWVRREHNSDTMPDRPIDADSASVDSASVDGELMAALLALPPRMRAVVVLRHVEDRSVEEVAEVLGCSTGNVKSQTARALDKLRTRLSPNLSLERNQS